MSKKRVNPNKVLLKNEIDIDQMLRDASQGNMYRSWLLVFPTLLRRSNATTESVLQDWDTANDYIADLAGDRLECEIARAGIELRRSMPYPHIDPKRIRTQADFETVKRRLQQNALYSGICLTAIGLKKTGHYTHDDLLDIYFDVDLTLAEIEHGVLSYDTLHKQLKEQGIEL